MVLFDGFILSYPWQKGFTTACITGKIMGFHRTDNNNLLSFCYDRIKVHFRSIGTSPQVGHRVIFSIVVMKFVLSSDFFVDFLRENHMIFFQVPHPVTASSYNKCFFAVSNLRVNFLQNFSRRCRTSPIINNDNQWIITSDKIIKGFLLHWMG